MTETDKMNMVFVGCLCVSMFLFGYLTASYQIRIEIAQEQLAASKSEVQTAHDAMKKEMDSQFLLSDYEKRRLADRAKMRELEMRMKMDKDRADALQQAKEFGQRAGAYTAGELSEDEEICVAGPCMVPFGGDER